MSSQRDYRKVVRGKGRNWRAGTLVDTIDLTKEKSGDENDESVEEEKSVKSSESSDNESKCGNKEKMARKRQCAEN